MMEWLWIVLPVALAAAGSVFGHREMAKFKEDCKRREIDFLHTRNAELEAENKTLRRRVAAYKGKFKRKRK